MIFCSESLSGGDFRAVIIELQKSNTLTPVFVFGGFYAWYSYLKALAAGGYDYVICPPNPTEVERIIWLARVDTVDVKNVWRAAA